MCLPQSLAGTKVRALNKAEKKWIHCQVSGKAMLLRLHKGLTPPQTDTENSVWISCEGKKDERELSPSRLSNIYIVLPLEVCQSSGK